MSVDQVWATLADEFDALCELHPRLRNTNNRKHLGTLGTGNHFIEVCLDEAGFVWFMLHSLARRATPSARTSSSWPRSRRAAPPEQPAGREPGLFREGAQYFGHYVRAVSWAQKFALRNREVMMANLIATVQGHRQALRVAHVEAVNCHHNYVQRERHFGEDVRDPQGAVSAKRGELGIIPQHGARVTCAAGQPESLKAAATAPAA